MADTESWRDIEARFRELQTSGGNLCAHWISTSWNEAGEQWYLSGSRDKRLDTRFTWTAEHAVLKLGHSGGSSAAFLWLDLLRRDSPNFRGGGHLATRLADGPEIHAETGTIERICEASADYCLKLQNETTKEISDRERGRTEEPFRWYEIDQKLVTLKLSDLSKEMQKKFAKEKRRVQNESRKTVNSGAYWPKFLDMCVSHTDEWLSRTYQVYCDVWTTQGKENSADFIGAVLEKGLVPVIAVRRAVILGEMQLRSVRMRETIDATAEDELTRRLQTLQADWKTKLDIEAIERRYPKAHPETKYDEPIFTPSADYRSIRFNRQSHALTRNQATIIKTLHEAYQRGTPWVGKAQLLAGVESETSRVQDSFKRSPLWQTLVVSGERKGTYGLNLAADK